MVFWDFFGFLVGFLRVLVGVGVFCLFLGGLFLFGLFVEVFLIFFVECILHGKNCSQTRQTDIGGTKTSINHCILDNGYKELNETRGLCEFRVKDLLSPGICSIKLSQTAQTNT